MAPQIFIAKLSNDEVKNLSIEKLASRMDAIIYTNEIERYGAQLLMLKMGIPGQPSVKNILNTKHVQLMHEDKQREVCHLTFNTLLQIQYTNVAMAASNLMVYGPNFDKETSWKSAKIQINSAALSQFEIVSSRISLECFMQLLHFLGEGERIRARKSTFKSFKKWLNDPTNPFSYFATLVLNAFVFDRNLRTPEVHAASKLSSRVLQMRTPASEDGNTVKLASRMLNVWRPLIDILNGGKPTYMTGDEEDFKWQDSYLHDDDEEKEKFL